MNCIFLKFPYISGQSLVWDVVLSTWEGLQIKCTNEDRDLRSYPLTGYLQPLMEKNVGEMDLHQKEQHLFQLGEGQSQ